MENQVIITPFDPTNPKYKIKIKQHYWENVPSKPGCKISGNKSFTLDKFNELITYIDNHEKTTEKPQWKNITVGKKSQGNVSADVVDTKVRSSMTLNKDYHISFENERKYYYDDDEQGHGFDVDPRISIYNPKTGDEVDISLMPLNTESTRFDPDADHCGIADMKLIRYQEGDHFDEFHYDTFTAYSEAAMIGTALIFPPNTINQFTGGELVFKVEEEDQELTYTIDPMKFTQWTMVTFGKLLHKANPVISGVRYVIKGNIWSMFPNIHKPIDITPASLDSYIANHYCKGTDVAEKHLATIKETISKFFEMQSATMLEAINSEVTKNTSFEVIEKKECEEECRNKVCGCCQFKGEERDPFIKNYKVFLEDLEKKKVAYNNIVNFQVDVSAVKTFEQTPDNKTIFILDSYYNQPYDFSTFDLGHLMKIKKLMLEGWKISLFNRGFSKYTPFDECDRWGQRNPYKVSNIGNYKWQMESYRYPGEEIYETSEYNDQSGNDITTYYQSTCLYCWK